MPGKNDSRKPLRRPGAGKTTAAWEIAAALKKAGVVTEYVPEYAKELVWDGRQDLLDGSRENQSALVKEQARRIERLVGKVSVIVTDSPILLGLLYQKEPYQELKQFAFEKHSAMNNFNLFIKRGNDSAYEQAGRIHTKEQSVMLDEQIHSFLDDHNIFYGTYSRNQAERIAANIRHSIDHNKRFKESKNQER